MRLTAPETVAITLDQYRQAVELLAAMMLNYHYVHRSPAELPDNQPLHSTDPSFPGYGKPQVRAGGRRQGVLMP
jgi:hypothetical protein